MPALVSDYFADSTDVSVTNYNIVIYLLKSRAGFICLLQNESSFLGDSCYLTVINGMTDDAAGRMILVQSFVVNNSK